VKRFPFPLTNAQNRAVEAILGDFGHEQAMTRLLEGDVGSGKTAVAAAAAFAAVTTRPSIVNARGERVPQKFGNLQVAYMCPTEILATQQFESFIQYFSYLPIRIALITGSGCRVFPSKVNPKGWTDIARNQLLQWVGNGEVAVTIGTHALIQKSVAFKHLAFVIIDEQHRFGTTQRAKLLKKSRPAEHGAQFPKGRGLSERAEIARTRQRQFGEAEAQSGRQSREASSAGLEGTSALRSAIVPHLLSMTATPIPRTLALTLYGDLDLTLLDESPAGRKPVATEIVYPTKRQRNLREDPPRIADRSASVHHLSKNKRA
jgi:ATP-dependent DNA helicase RecG